MVQGKKKFSPFRFYLVNFIFFLLILVAAFLVFLLLAGGGVNISGANACFRKLAEITNVPVVTTIMGRGAIPTDHPLFIGNLGMHGSYASNMAVGECDLLFSIGTRFNDRITGKLSHLNLKKRADRINNRIENYFC